MNPTGRSEAIIFRLNDRSGSRRSSEALSGLYLKEFQETFQPEDGFIQRRQTGGGGRSGGGEENPSASTQHLKQL